MAINSLSTSSPQPDEPNFRSALPAQPLRFELLKEFAAQKDWPRLEKSIEPELAKPENIRFSLSRDEFLCLAFMVEADGNPFSLAQKLHGLTITSNSQAKRSRESSIAEAFKDAQFLSETMADIKKIDNGAALVKVVRALRTRTQIYGLYDIFSFLRALEIPLQSEGVIDSTIREGNSTLAIEMIQLGKKFEAEVAAHSDDDVLATTMLIPSSDGYFSLLTLGDISFFRLTQELQDSELHTATRLKQHNVIDGLLETKIDLNRKGHSGNTALHIAFEQLDLDSASRLLKKGAALDALNSQHLSPFALACLNHGIQPAVLFLEQLAARELVPNPLVRNRDEISPTSSLTRSDLSHVQSCLDAVKALNDGNLLAAKTLSIAISGTQINLPLITLLSNVLPSFDCESPNPFTTSLEPIPHTLVRIGNSAALRLLGELGAPLGIQNADQQTIFHLCTSGIHPELIPTLFELNVPFWMLNNHGYSPLAKIIYKLGFAQALEIFRSYQSALLGQDAKTLPETVRNQQMAQAQHLDRIFGHVFENNDHKNSLSASSDIAKTRNLLHVIKAVDGRSFPSMLVAGLAYSQSFQGRSSDFTANDQLWGVIPSVLLGNNPSLIDAVARNFLTQHFSSDGKSGEAELLLFLNAPGVPEDKQTLLFKIIDGLTMTYGYSRRGIRTVNGQTVNLWAKLGMETFGFRRFRQDSRRLISTPEGKRSLLELFGAERAGPRHTDTCELSNGHKGFGASYVFFPHRQCKFPKDPDTFIELRQSYYLISHPAHGSLLIRNSSPRAGGIALQYPAWISKRGVGSELTIEQLLALSEENLIDLGFIPVIDARLEMTEEAYQNHLGFLLNELTLFQDGFDRWCFDTQAESAWTERSGRRELTGGYKSQGFSHLASALEALGAEQGKSNYSLAFYPRHLPPFSAYSFAAADGEKTKLDLSPAVLAGLSSLISGKAYDVLLERSGLRSFLQAGFNAQARLVIVSDDSSGMEELL